MSARRRELGWITSHRFWRTTRLATAAVGFVLVAVKLSSTGDETHRLFWVGVGLLLAFVGLASDLVADVLGRVRGRTKHCPICRREGAERRSAVSLLRAQLDGWHAIQALGALAAHVARR